MSGKKGAERKPGGFKTASDLPREAVYGPGDVREPDAIRVPGAYPFTRGLHETGYRAKLWTMRQYAGFGTAAESNRRYRYLLDRGTTGLSVAFDLPTQIGYDSDDPHARARSAASASPSTASRTWRSCSTASRWSASPPR